MTIQPSQTVPEVCESSKEKLREHFSDFTAEVSLSLV
jgi:hypothetical protein